MSDENPANGNDDVIGARLSEDDQNMLRAWYEHLILLDPRYSDKRVRTIAARAMVDDEFRRRLVGDTGSAVEEEPEPPDRFDVRFLANTRRTLNIVLPPRAGATGNLPTALRDTLRSRTSETAGLFQDDWFDSDPDTNDHSVGDGVDLTDGAHPVDGVDVWDTRVVAA